MMRRWLACSLLFSTEIDQPPPTCLNVAELSIVLLFKMPVCCMQLQRGRYSSIQTITLLIADPSSPSWWKNSVLAYLKVDCWQVLIPHKDPFKFENWFSSQVTAVKCQKISYQFLTWARFLEWNLKPLSCLYIYISDSNRDKCTTVTLCHVDPVFCPVYGWGSATMQHPFLALLTHSDGLAYRGYRGNSLVWELNWR